MKRIDYSIPVRFCTSLRFSETHMLEVSCDRIVVELRLRVRNFDFGKPCFCCSPWSVSLLRVRISAPLVEHTCFRRVMAESCLSFDLVSETSISRNHAYVVLHSRFPPFGFVFQPLWSDTHVSDELWRNRVYASNLCEKPRRRETIPAMFFFVLQPMWSKRHHFGGFGGPWEVVGVEG